MLEGEGASVDGEVLTDFHKADTVSVSEVIKVLKEDLLLSIRLVVITVLLDGFTDHVLTVGVGLIQGSSLVILYIKSNLGDRGIDVISFVNINNVSLNSSVTGLGSVPESVSNALHAVLVNLWAVSVLSVLVFEDLLLNEVLVVFMDFVLVRSLDEVEASRVKLRLGCDFHIVDHAFNDFVVRVILLISLEVISEGLLLLSEATEEESVVVSPSLTLSVKHAVLTSLVVFRVRELTGFKLLNAVELSVKSPDSLFNLNPGLVVIASIRDRELNSLSSKLLINFQVSHMHSVELLVSLLGPL